MCLSLPILLENFANKLFPFQFNEVEKENVIAYSTYRENEASKKFIQRKGNGIIINREICMVSQSLFSSHAFFFMLPLSTTFYFPEVHRFFWSAKCWLPWVVADKKRQLLKH